MEPWSPPSLSVVSLRRRWNADGSYRRCSSDLQNSDKLIFPSLSIKMPPKMKSKAVASFYNKNTEALTPKNRLAPNPPSDVQSNSSHMPQCKRSVHSNMLTSFSDFTLKKRRTAQHTHNGVVNRVEDAVNRVEDVEPTLQDPNGATNSSYHSPNEVHEDNYENIQEVNSIHIGSSTTATFRVRRTRGPTSKSACKPLKGQKWKCVFIDHQPVGEEASKLAEVLGLYARNDNYFQPYKEWREQSKQSLNDVTKELLVEYDFVDEQGMPANMADVTKFCEYSISNKVKEWRAALKKEGYMKGVNDELSVTPPNERVSAGTWDLLLQYWKIPKKIQETERNKKNRAEEQATHTHGAKSIARHHYEQAIGTQRGRFCFLVCSKISLKEAIRTQRGRFCFLVCSKISLKEVGDCRLHGTSHSQLLS